VSEIAPIYVPSKGRPRARAVELLSEEQLPLTLFVESDEAEEYGRTFPGVRIHERPRGLSLADVRQYMLEHARAQGLERYWQVDDNIRGFGIVVRRKVVKAPAAHVLSAIEFGAAVHGAALAAAQYQQFGWCSPRPWSANRYAYCCVLTSTSTGIDYRRQFSGKEDIDFCLQHIAAGHATLLANWFVMMKPKPGSTRGGQYDEFHGGNSKRAAEAVCHEWSWCTKLIVRSGNIPDVKVDWRKVRCKF
jgi:hypothetical protein